MKYVTILIQVFKTQIAEVLIVVRSIVVNTSPYHNRNNIDDYKKTWKKQLNYNHI